MTTPDTRQFLRDLVLLLGLPALLCIGLLAWWEPWNVERYAAATADEIFSIAEGTWDWSGADSFCLENPHRIWFSPNHDSMYIYYREPWTDSAGVEDSGAVYEIREHSPSHIRGFIVNEARRTESGELVVWDLVLLSPNSYAWHRTDWSENAVTNTIERCEEEET